MRLPEFLSKAKIRGDELLNQTIDYLVDKYNQSRDTFSFSSAYGQIVLVMNNLYKMVMYYISDVATQSNIHTANRQQTIFGISRLAGHNPSRGSSAIGTISLRLKDNYQKYMKGSVVYIPNYLRLSCSENSLTYLLDIGADDIKIDVNQQLPLINIIEGDYEFQIFTGTGESNQMIEVLSPNNRFIDDKNVIVSVNGKKYEQYDSLYEIPFGKAGVIVKTGIDSGIQLFFGNKINGEVPQKGSKIRVDYLLTSGSYGNILSKNAIFKFTDQGIDSLGNDVDLNGVFDIDVILPPTFGYDAEPPELTKILVPKVSRNYILHDTKSIEYYFTKMNYFNVVKTFQKIDDNQNMIDVMLIPDLRNRLLPGEDYFSMDIEKILLTEIEKNRLLSSIEESGRKSANIFMDIIDPEIRRFTAYIIIEVFKDKLSRNYDEDRISSDIRKLLSEYMLNNSRVNKIPHSDIVKLLDDIDYVDTAKVVFIPEFQEDVDSIGNMMSGDNKILAMRGGFYVDNEEILDEFDPKDGQGSVDISIKYV